MNLEHFSSSKRRLDGSALHSTAINEIAYLSWRSKLLLLGWFGYEYIFGRVLQQLRELHSLQFDGGKSMFIDRLDNILIF